MTVLLLIAGAVVVVFVAVLAWALCAMAKMSDRDLLGDPAHAAREAVRDARLTREANERRLGVRRG